MAASAMLAVIASGAEPATGAPQTQVALVRLAEQDMTPVELALTRDIPAGEELKLRSEEPLRPVWSGIYQITGVTAQGVAVPLSLRYEKSGNLPVLKAETALPSGTKLTLRGRKHDSVDPVRQRYAGRECRVWLEPLSSDKQPAEQVSAPLVVRTISGPAHYLQAYRKADGRLLIQAFDKEDNPADDTGVTYTITGGQDKPLSAQAVPGCELTDVRLPASLQSSSVITVSDNAGHTCRSSAVPRGIDGRSIFFGDIHCHTGFSDGDYPIEDAIAWARHRIGLDFTGPGDHISQEGDFGGLTATDYALFGRKYEQAGMFCRVPAFESSCAGGHQLLCARDFTTFVKMMADYVKLVGPTADTMDSAAFYQALAEVMPAGRAMVMPGHPVGHPNRWPDIPDKSRVRAAEIFRGGSSHEVENAEPNWLIPEGGARKESTIRHALDSGYRLGFLGESDNHRCLPGQPMVGFHGLTAVQALQLDTGSVFDAIRDGRCYATSGARIVADATLNQSPIGSEIRIAPDQARTFRIVVNGTAPIVETQIIHCGKDLKSFPAPADTHDVTIEWTDSPPAGRNLQGHEYYYVRVRQTDGHAAWLSPFWVRTP
jgi:hypothetical protein